MFLILLARITTGHIWLQELKSHMWPTATLLDKDNTGETSPSFWQVPLGKMDILCGVLIILFTAIYFHTQLLN